MRGGPHFPPATHVKGVPGGGLVVECCSRCARQKKGPGSQSFQESVQPYVRQSKPSHGIEPCTARAADTSLRHQYGASCHASCSVQASSCSRRHKDAKRATKGWKASSAYAHAAGPRSLRRRHCRSYSECRSFCSFCATPPFAGQSQRETCARSR